MTGRRPRVHLRPGRRSVTPAPGETLMDALLRAEVPLGSSCGGRAACSACVVRVLRGADHLHRPRPEERALADREGFAADERAACCARLNGKGDVVVTTTYW